MPPTYIDSFPYSVFLSDLVCLKSNSHFVWSAELGKLKPVPVSKALHLLFDMGNPEMPPPPPPLPPINAKLIFVDRTNLTIQPEVDQLMQEDGEEESIQTIKLEVPSDLPPGAKASLLKKKTFKFRTKKGSHPS